MKETDLCQAICDFFSDTDLYFEVATGSGITDIVSKRDNIITGIEVKGSLSLKVIEQAWNNKMHYHYSYIATPSKQQMISGFTKALLREKGIGLLQIYYPSGRQKTYEIITPSLNRRAMVPKLHEYQKQSVPGSQNDRMTSFKYMVQSITERLKRYGDGTPFKDMMDVIRVNYSSPTSAKNTIYQHCRSGVIKDFYLKDGKFWLNKKS